MERLNIKPIRPWECSYDPLVLAEKRAETFNAQDGDLTGYDCRLCRNKGAIMKLREDGTLYTVPCVCMKTRKCLRKMEQSGLKNLIREKTFAAFSAEEPWQKALKEGAEAFAADPAGWFLICGQSGCGKTHLCTAICRERLLQGDSVRYMAWRDEIRVLKMGSEEPEVREKAMEELKNAQILYIDDLFKTGVNGEGRVQPSSADLNLAFEILNYRYHNNLCTILSTEKLTEELQSLDEALAGRILEKTGKHTYGVQRAREKNYRIRLAEASACG